MSNQNYLSAIHSYKYNEVTQEPKWKKKNKLSFKNGPHATVYMMNGDTYFGEWKDNLKHGHGTYFSNKTKRIYDGEWSFDKRCGDGTLSIREDDKLYDIPSNVKIEKEKKTIMDGYYEILKNGTESILKGNAATYNTTLPKKTSKNAKMRYRKLYVGQWMDDKFNGYGTYYYYDGVREYYEGYWENNMNEGWGVMYYKDGSYYEGEWHRENRHGQGVLMLKNGDFYEGMWMNGEKEGPGKFIYKSKRQKYEGEWSKGIPKCGTIVDISSLPEYPERKYPIPPLKLLKPDEVLKNEYKKLTIERLNTLYNQGEIDFDKGILEDDTESSGENENDDSLDKNLSEKERILKSLRSLCNDNIDEENKNSKIDEEED